MAARVAMAWFCYIGSTVTAHADIVIGVAVPAHGLKANYGVTLVAAAQAEAARMNATGRHGVVTLAIEDDQCTSSGGADAAVRLVAKQVTIVIGHPCSNAAIAAANVYARAGVALVVIGARHPELTAKRAGPNVFRLGGRDDAQGAETARLIHDGKPGGKTIIIHDRTVYARRLADGVATGLRTYPGTHVQVQTIVAGEKDYSAVVALVAAAQPDSVYFAGFPIEGAIILRQLRATGSAVRFIGCDALNDTAFAATAGAASAGAELVTSTLALDGGALVTSALAAFAGVAGSQTMNLSAQLGSALQTDVSGDGAGASFELRVLGAPHSVGLPPR